MGVDNQIKGMEKEMWSESIIEGWEYYNSVGCPLNHVEGPIQVGVS